LIEINLRRSLSQPVLERRRDLVTLTQFGGHLPQSHCFVRIFMKILETTEKVCVFVPPCSQALEILVEEFEVSFEVEFGVPQCVSRRQEGGQASSVNIVISEEFLKPSRQPNGKGVQFFRSFPELEIPDGDIPCFQINKDVFKFERNAENVLQAA
jgi:hypothetical protein